MNVCFARRPIAEVECRTPLRRRHHRVQIGCPGPGSGLVWDRTWRASGSGTGPKASGCTSSNPKKPRNPRSFVTSARCESRLACPSCTCLHTFVAHPRPDCGPGFGFSVRLRRTGCPKPAPEARPGCSVCTVSIVFSFGTPYVQSGRLSIQALTSLPFSVVLEELRTFSTKQLPIARVRCPGEKMQNRGSRPIMHSVRVARVWVSD